MASKTPSEDKKSGKNPTSNKSKAAPVVEAKNPPEEEIKKQPVDVDSVTFESKCSFPTTRNNF